MPGGTGQPSHTESQRVLARVMLPVLVVSCLASLLGQAYADLIRPAGSRVWTPTPPAVATAGVAAVAVLLILSKPRFRRLVGAPLTAQHAVLVAVVFFVV